MLLAEIIAPLIVALMLGYAGLAYRLSLPSPIASKHDRALAHIAQLEHDLGIDYTQPDAVPPLPDDVVRVAIRAPRDALERHYATRFKIEAARRAAKPKPPPGYDGPALTDEDVRRIEHPDEFR